MKKRYFYILLIVLLVIGCADTDMFKNIHIRPNTTLPLGNTVTSDVSLFELADLKMQLGADGVLTFVDSTSLPISKSGDGAPIVKVPDQNLSINKNIDNYGGTGDIHEGEVIEVFPFAYLDDNVTLDAVIFNSGTFKITINGLETVQNYDKKDLKIVVHSLIKDKQPVTLESGVPLALNADYMLVFESGNKIKVEFKGKVPATLTELTGKIEIFDGDINYVAGFFGYKNLNTSKKTISVGTLKKFSEDAAFIRFDRPEVVLELNNRYNIPMLVDIDYLKVNGSPVEINPGLDGKLILVKPKSTTTVVIDNAKTVSGTGLTDVMTKDFQDIEISVKTSLNPTVDDLNNPTSTYVPPTHNSMYASDTLGGMFVIKLPIDGVLDKVSFDHELEVDLNDMDDYDFEQMTLTLSGSNQLPLDLKIIASVREPGSTVSIPLFDDPIEFPSSNNMKPGTSGFLPGIVNESNLLKIEIPSDKIDLLMKSDKLYLHLTASTFGAAARTSAQIYSPSELNLTIVLGAKLDYVIGEE